jgi:hypothetical protein
VGKQTEEELKDKIFKEYTEYYNNSSSDRRQRYVGRLFDLIFLWCSDYLFNRDDEIEGGTDFPVKEANKMGLEIFNAVTNCVEKDKKPKEDFLFYLEEALRNANNQYHRNKVEGPLRIPRIIKEIKKIIKMEENDRGKKLTVDESVQCISKWFCTSEKQALVYLKNMNRQFINNTGADEEDDDNIDIAESMAGRSLTLKEAISSPHDDILAKNEVMIISDALKAVLSKSKKKKPFYRALFTWHCIEYFKDYEKFLPVLDVETIEDYKKNGAVPNQFEIYMKCYPDAEKSTAQSNASGYSKEFFEDLYDIMKEKYPDIIKYFEPKRNKKIIS